MRLHINGVACGFFEGQTILQVAAENGFFIPTLCFGEGIAPSGACGICIVEIEGRLVRACATAARDGMEVAADSEAVLASRRTLLELTLSAHAGDCVAPCKIACPAETDCQGFIALVAAGKFREAVELMHDAHPFPASVSRICPRPCEEKCRRAVKDEAINIAGIKRFAADFALSAKLNITPKTADATGRSVAIVGGGPAGLTAAFFLKKAGHGAVVFEAMPKFGGLLRYGIPEYRLPKAVLDAEIGALERMGIDLFPGVAIGRDLTLEFLQARYDAVIIAVGAGISKPIWCKGEDAEGVFGGIDFLKTVAENKPPKIGRRVVVIGGSNTAMDAARTARRLGADVIVAYRRTRDEMPAERIEVEEALAEGVKFNFLTAPLEILAENGRTYAIKLQKMRLGEPDESGRRSPVPVEGGEETLEADTIIAAIGQDVSTDGLNPLESLKVADDFRTNLPRVFAIGDATGKSWYAIDAIGHGRKVAEIVHGEFCSFAAIAGRGASAESCPISEQLPEILVREEKTARDLAHMNEAARQNAAHMIPDDVRGNFAPVQAGLSPAEAAAEAARCLSCGCADFFECKLVALANIYGAEADKFSAEFHRKPKHEIDTSNFYFHRDMNKCVLCGLCVAACAARQARSGNRGHVSVAAHALEAGERHAARQARSENRGHVSVAAHALEAGERHAARQARSENRGHVSAAAHALEAGERHAAISAINRGFDTKISAAFEKPLQNRDECSLCGNCVARCPVGALTEASPLPKQFVARENFTETVCTLCGNTCGMKIATKAGEILRCLPTHEKARQARVGHRGHMSESAHSLEAASSFPAHEKARQARSGHRGHVSAAAHSLEAASSFPAHEKIESASDTRRLILQPSNLCEHGRFGFLNFGEKIITPLVRRDGLLRRATLRDATKAIREGLSVIAAQYGTESIGIAVSPQYVNEDISAIVDFAARLGTPHIFTFADVRDEEKTYCNTEGLKKAGVSTKSEKFLQKIREGEIKGLVIFGEELPAELAKSGKNGKSGGVHLPEFLAVQAAYTAKITGIPARDAQVILPAPAFGEVSGTITRDTGEILPVNPALTPACGYQAREMAELL